ncbi:response regulator [Halioxenophilus sp. WMMB6]|uniref:response regulator n=1 Tax=Halioxenophilus sp. WMMB6 TaxID=3073815 RepID=UPI00295E2812|nr:response regulator [Halioxenophilus sp. WMMB6]
MNRILISHYWLSPKDIRMIRNIFNVGTDWLKSFQLMDAPNKIGGEIAIVNISHPMHWQNWKIISREQNFVLTIAVTDIPDLHLDDAIILRRPIVHKRLSSALSQITELGPGAIQHEESPGILVVDDNVTVRTYMKQKLESLTRNKVDIHLACSGEEAIEFCKHRFCGLIFMDVIMTGIDGYSTCNAIKKEFDSRVVMLTSRSSTFDKIRGRMSSCDGYLTKPVSDHDLALEIRNFISKTTQKREAGVLAESDLQNSSLSLSRKQINSV